MVNFNPQISIALDFSVCIEMTYNEEYYYGKISEEDYAFISYLYYNRLTDI